LAGAFLAGRALNFGFGAAPLGCEESFGGVALASGGAEGSGESFSWVFGDVMGHVGVATLGGVIANELGVAFFG